MTETERSKTPAAPSRIARVAAKFIALWMAITLAFSGALVLAYCIPTSMIDKHVKQSLSHLAPDNKNYWYMLPGKQTLRLDDYATAVMLNLADHGSSDPIVNAFANPQMSASGKQSQPAILASGIGLPDSELTGHYSRYWHGYLVFLKPLLVFFNLAQIRTLAMASFSFLLLVATALLARREGVGVAIGFALPFFLLNYWTAIYSPPLSAPFWIGLLASLYVIVKTRRGYDLLAVGEASRWALRMFAIGALTVYFDFLTAPLITLGMPLALLLVLSRRSLTRSDLLRTLGLVIGCCATWALGYFGLWVTKWALATAITPYNIFEDAASQASIRLDTYTSERKIQSVTRLDSLMANVRVMGNAAIPMLLLPFAVYAYALIRRAVKRDWVAPPACVVAAIVILAILPAIWYVVLVNHSVQHYWFTYREFLVTLSCLYLLAGACIDDALSHPWLAALWQVRRGRLPKDTPVR